MGDLFIIESTGIWSNIGYYKDKIIEGYESLIWTERFIEAGDVQLTIPATEENRELIIPDTMLGLDESRVPMLIDTVSIENGLMTAKGYTLEKFFNERYSALATNTFPNHTPGEQFEKVINDMQNGTLMGFTQYAENGPIPGLEVGVMDDGGASVSKFNEKWFWNPAYDILLSLARKHHLDIGVYRVSSGLGHAYELHFSIRAGLDLTTNQDVNDPVRFSVHLDNFANVKELYSTAGSKTHVLIFPPLTTSAGVIDPVGVTWGVIDDWEGAPFQWRFGVLQPESIDFHSSTIDPTGSSTLSEKKANLRAACVALGKKYLREHRPSKVLDGEVTPESRYRYYSDYNPESLTTYRLGDIVEFQGPTGPIRQGTVTEHIRSYGKAGQRSYPTISPVTDAFVDYDESSFAT